MRKTFTWAITVENPCKELMQEIYGLDGWRESWHPVAPCDMQRWEDDGGLI